MSERALKYFEPDGWDEIKEEVQDNANELLNAETPIEYSAGMWGMWYIHAEGKVGVSLKDVAPKMYHYLNDLGHPIHSWWINRVEFVMPERNIVTGNRGLHFDNFFDIEDEIIDYTNLDPDAPSWMQKDFTPLKYPVPTINTPLNNFEGSIWVSAYELPETYGKDLLMDGDMLPEDYKAHVGLQRFELKNFPNRIRRLDVNTKSVLLNAGYPHELIKATPGIANRLIVRFKDQRKALELFDV